MTLTVATDGGHRRFVAPPRAAVDARRFAHPLFAGLAAYVDLLQGEAWPAVSMLGERLALPGLHLVEQDAALLADGLHYEVRIARGQLATRADNWHDLFNALVWACHAPIKRALNARQCLHIAQQPRGHRNRAQAALTQFDESGVVVRVADAALLAAWDAHDWPALFAPAAWHGGAISIAAVFGHALMEQGLLPARRLLGKCVVVQADDDATALALLAEAISEGRVLTDPLQLRPLPMMGIPGWCEGTAPDPFADRDYFRPLREGRRYPPPLR